MKGKLLTVACLILLTLSVVSCGVKAAEETTNVTSTPVTTMSISTTTTKTPATTDEYKPPEDNDWISPGKVNIANFRAGARAEYPITVHNGSDGVTIEVKQITTNPGETAGDIPIKRVLAYPDRLNEIKLISDNENDNLNVTKSGDGFLTIEGFAPDASRKVTIEYAAMTNFKIYYRIPTKVGADYVAATAEQEDWILIADATAVFLPRETRDILITLSMPPDAIAPGNKWEFWIAVAPESPGSINTELVSRWLIAMR